jgi:hypothetical protein
VTIPEGTSRSFTVTAVDADGDPIQLLTAAPLPAGATFTVNAAHTAGTFSWTPSFAQAGTYGVTFTACNALCGSATTAILVCDSCDRAPLVTAPASVSALANILLAFQVFAADPDGEAIASFTAAPLPPGATFSVNASNTTGTFSWTPSNAQVGQWAVVFSASNSLSGSANTFITVGGGVNRPPVADAGGPYQGFPGIPVNFDGSGSSDPDGDPLTYDWTFGDGGTGSGAQVSHIYALEGIYPVGLTVTDPSLLSGSSSTTAEISSVCEATLFQTGSDKTLRLGSGKSVWCTELEPNPSCYSVDQIVVSSILLKYPAGQGAGIPANGGKISIGGDANHNGLEELTVCFLKEDLRGLFSGLPAGENLVTVSIEGDLVSGGRFVGTGTLRVFATGGALAARITPIPLRGSGEISFVTRQAGPARVRLFDLQGRTVRTLLDDASAGPGIHAVRLDGRGSDGGPLAAGVYFFRIEADGKEETGRMVIAR